MDRRFMEMALELSKKGIGFTKPNPLVGAVIVKDGRVIGEGYHQYYGGPHAEINALNSAEDEVKGATMYVTLEPCSHYGKTPPCANAIAESGITRVVVGMQDPNPLVAGKGITILEKNGIEVVTGILEDDIKELNEIFIKYITTGMPFCILKAAMTLDGKTATAEGDSKWITGEASRNYVHQLRHRVSAVMVGIGTVLADDPMLTTRLNGTQGVDAARVIVDTEARIPLTAKVLNLKSDAKTIVASTNKADQRRLDAIRSKGADVIITPLSDGKVDLAYLCSKLGERGIDSILLEGGSELNYSALKQGIVDKVTVFISPKIVGGSRAKTPVGGRGIPLLQNASALAKTEVFRLGEDFVIEGYIRKGENDNVYRPD